MGLFTILLLLFLQIYGISGITKRLAYFNKTGELPCLFKNPKNLSWNELVIFWQDQNKLVLFDFYQGIEKPATVDPRYKGRTSFDRDSSTLKLHDVQIQDEGIYSCFVHHKKPEGMLPIDNKSTQLSVYANFSQPNITSIPNGTKQYDSKVNLTCSSTNGYPEPTRMWFLIEQEAASRNIDAVMKKSQNDITKLYTVSISESFSSSLGADNASIFCVLQNKHEELRSLPYKIVLDVKTTDPPPPAQELFHWILPICLILAVVFLMVLIKCKKNKKPGLRPDSEASQMEAKGEEQSRKRLKCDVSERVDETQCFTDVSKTSSGDRSATDT